MIGGAGGEASPAERAVGFLAPAHAGEVYELTLPERLDLLHCLRALTKSRTELIAGATGRDERECIVIRLPTIAVSGRNLSSGVYTIEYSLEKIAA